MANDTTIPARLRGPDDATLLAQARDTDHLGEAWRRPPSDYPILRSFAVYAPKHSADKFLVVLKGYDADGEIVAFYKGEALMGAIAKALRRVLSRSVEWKRETPYRDRGA